MPHGRGKRSGASYGDSHIAPACADDYDAHYARGRGYFYWQFFEKPYLDRLFARLGKEFPGRYLDFACGTGRILQLGAPYFSESVGIDVSETMLAAARRRAPAARLIRADVAVAPPEVGVFNVISLFRFLLNAEDGLRQIVLGWLRRVIAPQGVLVVNNHLNRSSIAGLSLRLRNLASRSRRSPVLSESEVEKLMHDNGFRIFERYGFGFFPPTRFHRILPLGWLASLERRIQRVRALEARTQDRIYLCRPV
jgi:ubiquinone/menaquinone biosynthesis C-methylase UbiE